MSAIRHAAGLRPATLRPIVHLAAAALLVAGCAGASGPATRAPATATVPAITPTAAPASPVPTITVEPAAVIALEGSFALAGNGTEIWASSPTGASRLDPTTNTVTATVAFGGGADEIEGIGVNSAGVWVSDYDTDSVYRIDPKRLKVVATVPVGFAPEAVVATDSAVWVSNHHGGSVSRIDPLTNTVVATIPAGHAGSSGPQAMSLGLGSLWVSVSNIQSVVRIDAVSNAVQASIYELSPALPCGGIAVAPTAVWVSSCAETRTIARIDPATNAVVAMIDMGGFTGDPFIVNGEVWFPVADHIAPDGGVVRGTIAHVDAATNQVDRALAIADRLDPGGSLLLGDSFWIADGSSHGRIVRVPLSAFK